jgi:hypothetical protein
LLLRRGLLVSIAAFGGESEEGQRGTQEAQKQTMLQRLPAYFKVLSLLNCHTLGIIF